MKENAGGVLDLYGFARDEFSLKIGFQVSGVI